MIFAPEISKMKRIELLEEALSTALDRGQSLQVEDGVNGVKTVWAGSSYGGESVGFDLYEIARDLERDLSCLT